MSASKKTHTPMHFFEDIQRFGRVEKNRCCAIRSAGTLTSLNRPDMNVQRIIIIIFNTQIPSGRVKTITRDCP